MKSMRDYLNLLTESTGEWKFARDLHYGSPKPVPGTNNKIYTSPQALYVWSEGSLGRGMSLTDTVRTNYLLVVEISNGMEEPIDGMNLELATKLIRSSFDELLKTIGMKDRFNCQISDVKENDDDEDGMEYEVQFSKTTDQT